MWTHSKKKTARVYTYTDRLGTTRMGVGLCDGDGFFDERSAESYDVRMERWLIKSGGYAEYSVGDNATTDDESAAVRWVAEGILPGGAR